MAFCAVFNGCFDARLPKVITFYRSFGGAYTRFVQFLMVVSMRDYIRYITTCVYSLCVLFNGGFDARLPKVITFDRSFGGGPARSSSRSVD